MYSKTIILLKAQSVDLLEADPLSLCENNVCVELSILVHSME